MINFEFEDILENIERTVMWIYVKQFSMRHSNLRDDLLQEGRINIWNEYKRTDGQIDRNQFCSYLPKLAYQGMIMYLRKIYHLQSESKYLECQSYDYVEKDVNLLWNSKDYTLQERLLFYDICKVLEANVYKNSERIRDIIVLLYQGYGFQEIAEMKQTDRGNIWKSSRRFGRRLLQAWA
jgi:RNA polymerase sigma factor (sigma-70 family)